MREILFRGKRVYDGKWSESVCPHGEMHSGTVTNDYDRNTVCQYTGLTDKNGKKIFEGDILKLEDYHGHRVVYVFYGESCGCWFYGGDRFSDEYIFNGQFKEVIGNIFDNPELLTED